MVLATVILFLVALVLIFAEAFIPSGGIITAFSVACLVAGGIIAFRMGNAHGTVFIMGFIVLAPLAYWCGFKVLPYTPFVLKQQISSHSKIEGLAALVGKQGITEGQLHPTGKVRIDNKLYDAHCNLEIVESGTTVTVVGHKMGELQVEQDIGANVDGS